MDKQNFVFISYNHKDVKWAKWLQQRLEWFRLPTEAHNEISDSRFIRPVFRDRDTLTAGILNDELRRQLEASQYLVVICSPYSARSEWVSDEVKAFIDMGRLDKIVPFVVDDSSMDYMACLPASLRQWNLSHPEKNILGIAVTDDGKKDKEKAFIRLVSYLLGISFDTLWHRHLRFVRQMASLVAVLGIIMLTLAYWFMMPVKLNVTLVSESCCLPEMEKAIVTVNGSEFSVDRPDTSFFAGTLPGYYRLRPIQLSFRADRFYADDNLTVTIGAGLWEHIHLQTHRDSTFAFFCGRVFDGDAVNYLLSPIAGAIVSVGGKTTKTETDGSFRVAFTLEEQTETKAIMINKDGYRSFHRQDEYPSQDLVYLLHK